MMSNHKRQIYVKILYMPTIALFALLLVPGISYGQTTSVSPSSSSERGWVSLTSDPMGALVYVDNQPLMGQDGKQLVTPCKAYIDAGSHVIKLTMNGYADTMGTVKIQANTEHDPVFMSLDKIVVPGIITPLIAIIILLAIILVPIGVVSFYIIKIIKNK